MKPIKIGSIQGTVFNVYLKSIIDPEHELSILSKEIDWDYFHKEFSNLFKGKTGKPPKSVRLIIGLMILEYVYDLSDIQVVKALNENIYFQYFCGNIFLEKRNQLCPTTLVKWRNKLGIEGADKILSKTVEMTKKLGILKKKEEGKVIADTTVQEKNIKYPTDTELIENCRKKLVKYGKKIEIIKRDSNLKKGKKALEDSLRYARGNKREKLEASICNQKKMLETTLIKIKKGKEKIKNQPKGLDELIKITDRLLKQTKNSKQKIYSLKEPGVYCISKGKQNKKYEFGCKVGKVISIESGIVLSSKAYVENIYDGDSLDSNISHAEKTSKIPIKRIFADKGYKKQTDGIKGTPGTISKNQELIIPNYQKILDKKIKKGIKRRSSIEARISESKRLGKLDKNYLKGSDGDKINASMCGVGQNIRIILRYFIKAVKSKKLAA